MCETPLVSIVIPIYNTEAFLLSATESAVNQTYKNKEVILVEDDTVVAGVPARKTKKR